MSQKREYDAAVGGDIVLENHVQTYKYANAALKEIRTLMAASKQPTGTKLIFQTLPKHIRRRAMSHHPKRLPRKYRTIHIAQMAKSGKQRILRRPSRKFRRRPSNLLQDYLRRQRGRIWLETHIWFAKRFHMVERWGYRLPLNSCDKTYRACYRATAEHCLVQDISFHACIELKGTVSCLFSGIRKLSNNGQTTSNGLTIKAVTFLRGQREGSIDLFRKRQFPTGALCRANFMWRPIDSEDCTDENQVRTLWIWVHPCAHSIILEEMISVFEVLLVKEETSDPAEDSTEANAGTKKEKTRFKFLTKNLVHSRIKCYANLSTGITLIDLKDTLNRFRLTGPLSQSVLTHAFKIFDSNDLCEMNDQADDSDENWFQKLSHDEGFLKQHNDQANYWEQCKLANSPAALRSNMIIALNIVDPRLQRPTKRSKAVPQTDNLSASENGENTRNLLKLLVDVPQTLAHSSLWDENIRRELRSKLIETRSWCQLREKHALVPGAPCAFESSLQPIPVVLIQRPGLQDNHKRIHYGCGWDVIAPAGYGMPIWLTLIMWGAKPGGLRELHSLAREMGNEMHLPDTIGGRQYALDRHKVTYDKYFRLPPGKRHNYTKLAIASPFRAPWIELIRDWLPENDDMTRSTFFVERDKLKLMSLSKLVRNLPSVDKGSIFKVASDGLIQIQLRMRTRGNIGSNALICLPTLEDIKTHNKRSFQQSNCPVYTEPLLPDLNEKERKAARITHKKQLKRLRQSRLCEKRKLQETSTTRVLIRPAKTAPLVSAHFARMCKLWLNENCETYFSVLKQCSRDTFGYVTEASFSFTNGTVCAVGYITLPGLQKLLCLFHSMKRKPMCLLRDTKSRHYYFATFEISENP